MIRVRWGDFYEAKNVYLPGDTGFFTTLPTLAEFHYGYSDSTVLHNVVGRNTPQNRTMFRALLRHDEALQMLLSRDKNGMTPLHIACEFLKPDFLKIFLEDVRAAHERAEEDRNERIKAAKSSTTSSGNDNSIDLSFEFNSIPSLASILNVQDNTGKTPLFCCTTGNLDILLERFGKYIRKSLTLYSEPRLSPYFYFLQKYISDSKKIPEQLKPCTCVETTSKRGLAVIRDEEQDYNNIANLHFDGFYDFIHELQPKSNRLIAKKDESLLLWEKGIKQLLDLCGQQTCVGMKKDLLQRLLQQTRGLSREFYRKEFEDSVKKNFEVLTSQLSDLHDELVEIADERMKPKESKYFKFNDMEDSE